MWGENEANLFVIKSCYQVKCQLRDFLFLKQKLIDFNSSANNSLYCKGENGKIETIQLRISSVESAKPLTLIRLEPSIPLFKKHFHDKKYHED